MFKNIEHPHFLTLFKRLHFPYLTSAVDILETHIMDSGDKSKYALLIGVPILVGSAACYYYYYNSKTSNNPKRRPSVGETKKVLSIQEQSSKLKDLGNKNFKRKKYDTAIDYYTQAIKLATDSIDEQITPENLSIFYQNRAACFEALEQYHKAVQDCTDAINLNKRYVKAYMRRAKAYRSLKENDKAIIDANIVNCLDNFQNETSVQLAEALWTEFAKKKAADIFKDKPETQEIEWPTNAEVKNYFSAFTFDPILAKTNNLSIRTSNHLQEIYDEAIKPENKDDPISILIKGSCYSLLNKTEEAEKCYDSLINDESCEVRIRSNALLRKSSLTLASLSNVEQNDFEHHIKKVISFLDKAFEIDPTNPDIHLHRAKILLLSEKPELAMKYLDKALDLKSDFYAAIAHKSYIQFKMGFAISGSLADNLAKFKQTLIEHPDSYDIRTMYVQILLEVNLFEEADNQLASLCKLFPGDAEAYLTRALLFMQLGDVDKAQVNLLEAQNIEPKNKAICDMLGTVAMQKKDYDEAIKIYKTVLESCKKEEEYIRFCGLLKSCESYKTAREIVDSIGKKED